MTLMHEVLSDALMELGALSTDLHDAAAGTEREQLLFDEVGEATGQIWVASEVTALFDEAADIPSILHGCDGCGRASLPAQLSHDTRGRAGLGPELLSLNSVPSGYPRACG